MTIGYSSYMTTVEVVSYTVRKPRVSFLIIVNTSIRESSETHSGTFTADIVFKYYTYCAQCIFTTVPTTNEIDLRALNFQNHLNKLSGRFRNRLRVSTPSIPSSLLRDAIRSLRISPDQRNIKTISRPCHNLGRTCTPAGIARKRQTKISPVAQDLFSKYI